jgi:hypothetical protein
MSSGWQQRLDVLRRLIFERINNPLQMHHWKTNVEAEIEDGEYIVMSATRGKITKRFAVLYTPSTSHGVYKRLASSVDSIFVNGQYKLEDFAQDLADRVTDVANFHRILIEWNNESTEGKFAPTSGNDAPVIVGENTYRLIPAEDPIHSIWLRLRQFQSITLAKKFLRKQLSWSGVEIVEADLQEKAEGIAYCLRNAADYFQTTDRNLSQRILNLYYGSMAFASAEIMAVSKGSRTLAEIEDRTKFGHGLYTIDGFGTGLEDLVMGVLNKGFFHAWMNALEVDASSFPESKPKKTEDLQKNCGTWISIRDLFASIPEVADLYTDIFDSPPRWMVAWPDRQPLLADAAQTYVMLLDKTGRISKNVVGTMAGPIGEISEVQAQIGRQFRVTVTHAQGQHWQTALNLHSSPFQRNAFIQPVCGVVKDYRAICFVLLYGLSIVVRYRPRLWRSTQEGDGDQMKILIEAFLAVVERVLPEQFLQTLLAEKIIAGLPTRF